MQSSLQAQVVLKAYNNALHQIKNVCLEWLYGEARSEGRGAESGGRNRGAVTTEVGDSNDER